jgi:hypothetical protein
VPTQTGTDTGTPEATGDTESTGDTASSTADTATSGVLLSASCALTPDNALRAWCDVTVAPPSGVQITFTPVGGGESRTVVSEAVEGSHRVGMYFLSAQTDYDTTVELLDGTASADAGLVTTGALPDPAVLTYTLTGTSTADWLLHASPCQNQGTLVVSDPAGEVVWYHQLDPVQVISMRPTPEGNILVEEDGDIVEIDWMGVEHSRIPESTHGLALHHDLFRSDDGYTYAIFSELQVFKGHPYNVDGVAVFDASGTRVATFRVADHFPPQRPDALHGIDVHHSNGLFVDDGVALLSVRHLSMVVAFVADPTAPDFGEVLWALEGNDAARAWRDDFTITSSDGGWANFKQQHHPVLHPDGTLTLFDNRVLSGQNSRALEIDLDPVAGTADIRHAYDLPMHCYFQGGFYYTDGGNALATCSPRGEAFEFAPGTDNIVYSLDARCTLDPTGTVPRYMPVQP